MHRWDVETGARIGRPFATGGPVVGLAFSPDGRLLAAGTAEPAFHAVIWDLDSGRRRGEPIAFRHWAKRLVFSPDGAHLAIGSSDGTTRLVDMRTDPMTSHLLQSGTIASIVFTGDGRHVLTSSVAARLWDVETGEPVSPPMELPRTSICAAAFSSDGTRLAVCHEDGSVGVWDIATASPIGAGWRLRVRGRCVAFGRDGRSLSVVDGRGNLRTWRMPEPIDGPVESVVRYVQSRTDKHFESGRSITWLDPKERRRLHDEFAAAPLTADETEEWGLHEASARDAEAVGDGYGALAPGPADRRPARRRPAARPSGTGLAVGRGCRLGSGRHRPRPGAGPARPHPRLDGPPRLDFHADKRPADAIRLLDRVIAERPDDWLAYALRAEDLVALGRPADREADLEGAMERGADISFLARIASERSRAGRWSEAVPVYDRAIAMGTVPYEVWMQAATAHLEIGDEAGFRRVCQTMRDRHPAAIFERNVGLTLASVATIAPGGVGDDGKVPGWIAPWLPLPDSMRAPMKRWILQALAAVLYRTGQYTEAISRTEESIALRRGRGCAR